MQTFRQHLVTQHTPDIMTTLICDSMNNWLQCTQVHPPTWDTPLEPIQHDLRRAFDAQRRIGWDQFFRGRLALAWKTAIATYYRDQ